MVGNTLRILAKIIRHGVERYGRMFRRLIAFCEEEDGFREGLLGQASRYRMTVSLQHIQGSFLFQSSDTPKWLTKLEPK